MKVPFIGQCFALALGVGVFSSHASGASVAVRFSEGVAHGSVVQSRLVFRFRDGSIYDETVVFSQRDAFALESYHLVQRGPSFPESIDAAIDRQTGGYTVRYRADDDSPEERLSGEFALPADVYSGMLGIILKNLTPGQSGTVQVLAFTPRPRLITVLLAPVAEDLLTLGGRPISTTRYLIKPELGLLASLLVVDQAPIQFWVVSGNAPAFVKFEGPLYFMGPVWRIELN